MGQGTRIPAPFCIFQEGKGFPETSSREEIHKTVCFFDLKSKLPQKNPSETSQCRNPVPIQGQGEACPDRPSITLH